MKSFPARSWPPLLFGVLLLGCAHHQQATTTCTEHVVACRPSDQASAPAGAQHAAPAAGKALANAASPLLIPPLDPPVPSAVAACPARTKPAKPSSAPMEWVATARVRPEAAKAPAAAPDRSPAGAMGSGPAVARAAPEPAKSPAGPLDWALIEPPPLPGQMAQRPFDPDAPGTAGAAPVPLDGTRASATPSVAAAPPTALPGDAGTGGKSTPSPVATDSLPTSALQAGGSESKEKPAPAQLPAAAPSEPAGPAPAGPPAAAAADTSGVLTHASNYSWLTGTLDYLHAKKIWTVRYAGLDEVDVYGGSVALVENERTHLERFKPGQVVRVEGHFADREPTGWCPRYQVDSIRPLP